jgi:hypothetical protein
MSTCLTPGACLLKALSQEQAPAAAAAPEPALEQEPSIMLPTVAAPPGEEGHTEAHIVRAGGAQRTLFRLVLRMSRLELGLAYEGATMEHLVLGNVDK